MNGLVKFLLRLLITLSTPTLLAWVAWMMLDTDTEYSETYSAL